MLLPENLAQATPFVYLCTVYTHLDGRVYIARKIDAQGWTFEVTNLLEIPFTKIELREFGE